MGSNVEEALRAKARSEKLFLERNFVGARNYALKAQKLCPELEGISQMVSTFGVYIASEAKIKGELDFYSILGLDPYTDKSKIKKQYKKMAALLHPDKNSTIGADGAFRLVSDAWTFLSDSSKRTLYDQRRYLHSGFSFGSGGDDKGRASQPKLDTFWTVCTSCHVQYEYLRKYVNKRLSCKNCRDVFIAVETGVAQMTSSFPHSSYTYGPENGYSTHHHGMTYAQTVTGYCTPNGHAGHQPGYRSDHGSSISFQVYASENSSGVKTDHIGLSSSSFVFNRENEAVNKPKGNKDHDKVKASGHVPTNGYSVQNDVTKPKRGRPSKKMKIDSASSLANGHEETSPKIAIDSRMNENGTLKPASRLLTSQSETSVRRSAAPTIDVRQMLINKARTEIRKKLEEMRLAADAAAAEAEKRKAISRADKANGTAKVSPGAAVTDHSRPDLKRTLSIPITVPDSDFHDFDKDRSEECFRPKQIWALYDEEDGMPRLYCLIREVISVNPFKVLISYLSSRSDCEFGPVNWLDCGFTKSCGSFRVFHSETVDQVNVFSHLLSREKAGRGGCVKIYPRGGDIWAVYKNWSPEWDRNTPDEVRHQYEMVEVLGDYTEENAVWVAPLIKLPAYKTVYQRNPDANAVIWIPRKEMLRFSHQVPAYSLQVEGTNLPEGCWDLDAAAIPDKLLLGESSIQNFTSSNQREDAIETAPFNEKGSNDQLPRESEEKIRPSDTIDSAPTDDSHVAVDTTSMGEKGFYELLDLQGKQSAPEEYQAINNEAELAPGTSTPRFLIDLN